MFVEQPLASPGPAKKRPLNRVNKRKQAYPYTLELEKIMVDPFVQLNTKHSPVVLREAIP